MVEAAKGSGSSRVIVARSVFAACCAASIIDCRQPDYPGTADIDQREAGHD